MKLKFRKKKPPPPRVDWYITRDQWIERAIREGWNVPRAAEGWKYYESVAARVRSGEITEAEAMAQMEADAAQPHTCGGPH